MKLRWQLVTAFAFAAAVPILVASYGARNLVRERYQAEFVRRANRIRTEMSRALEKGLDGERARVQQFCEGDVLIDKLFTNLAAGREPDVQEHLRGAMEGRGLDTLAIVDPRGRVLGSGHLPGAVGSIDEETLALSRSPDLPFVIREVRVRTAEGVRPRLALEHACRVERLRKRVGIVGGALFSRVLGRLTDRQDAQVFVLDESGAVIASTENATYPPLSTYPPFAITLKNPDGEVAAKSSSRCPTTPCIRTCAASISSSCSRSWPAWGCRCFWRSSCRVRSPRRSTSWRSASPPSPRATSTSASTSAARARSPVSWPRSTRWRST